MALAHVQVLPSTAVNGQSTEFTVRVPAEGGLTTTSVRVDFPSQVSVYAVADAPDWTSLLIKHPRRAAARRAVERGQRRAGPLRGLHRVGRTA